MGSSRLSDDDIELMTKLYDNLLETYKYIILMGNNIGKKMFDNNFAKLAQWINTFYKNVPDEYHQIIGFSSDDVNTVNKMKIIKDSIEKFLENDAVSNG